MFKKLRFRLAAFVPKIVNLEQATHVLPPMHVPPSPMPVKSQIKLAKPKTALKLEIDEIQQAHPNHILLIQVGMFYEIYDSANYLDEIASMLNLRIAILKTAIGQDHRYSRFAGFPMFELKKYLKILVDNGKYVAIVNQCNDNLFTNYIKRKVARIVTPGTVIDEDTDFTTVENTFLLSVFVRSRSSKKVGLAWADVSTGEFFISESEIADFPRHLNRIQPKEILVSESLLSWNNIVTESLKNESMAGVAITSKPDSFFNDETTAKRLAKLVVEVDPSKEILAENADQVLKHYSSLQRYAAIAMTGYLIEAFPSSFPPVRRPKDLKSEKTLRIDSNTFQALEIVQTQKERNRSRSLLAVVQNAITPPGKRLLISRIKSPSADIDDINSRLDIVQLFHDDVYLTEVVEDALKEYKDVEKALQRIHVQGIGGSDFAVVLTGLRAALDLQRILREYPTKDKLKRQIINNFVNKLGSFNDIVANYKDFFDTNKKIDLGKITSVDVVKTGYCQQIDDARDEYQNLLQGKVDLEESHCQLFEKKCTLTFDSKLGPYVELLKGADKTNARIDKIISGNPSFRALPSASVSVKRFSDTTWTELYFQMEQVSQNILDLQNNHLSEACESIKSMTQEILEISNTIAEIDIGCMMGKFAFRNKYTRPILTEKYHKLTKDGFRSERRSTSSCGTAPTSQRA